ncbi:MAG TPA: hypothetical protein VFQ61_11505 [Polyangiaceae bacterium]|nr:hypothetical protein [Polyangiaceae bacterium]
MKVSATSPARDEIVLPFPDAPGVAAYIRSTLLTSSLQSLRARGLEEKHSRLLPPEHRDTILSCVAGQWLPIAVGAAHYEACGKLGLSAAEQHEVGRSVSKQIHETLLGLTVKMARGVGLTPWTLLAKGNTLFSRLFRGGGTQITRLGASSARIEIAGLPLLEIPYFRNAVSGTYAAGIELLGRGASVRLRASDGASFATRCTFFAEWS